MAQPSFSGGVDTHLFLQGIEQGIRQKKEEEFKAEMADILGKLAPVLQPRVTPETTLDMTPPQPAANMDFSLGVPKAAPSIGGPVAPANPWSGSMGGGQMTPTPGGGKTTYPSNEEVSSKMAGAISERGGVSAATTVGLNSLFGKFAEPSPIHTVSPGASIARGTNIEATAPAKDVEADYKPVSIVKDANGVESTVYANRKNPAERMLIPGVHPELAKQREITAREEMKQKATGARQGLTDASRERVATGQNVSREKIQEMADKARYALQQLKNQGMNERVKTAADARKMNMQQYLVFLSDKLINDPEGLTDDEVMIHEDLRSLISKQQPSIFGVAMEQGMPPKIQDAFKEKKDEGGPAKKIMKGREGGGGTSEVTYNGKNYPVQKHPKSGKDAILVDGKWLGVD